jgi:hypothetical protein
MRMGVSWRGHEPELQELHRVGDQSRVHNVSARAIGSRVWMQRRLLRSWRGRFDVFHYCQN